LITAAAGVGGAAVGAGATNTVAKRNLAEQRRLTDAAVSREMRERLSNDLRELVEAAATVQARLAAYF
jgi:hypothetical protein